MNYNITFSTYENATGKTTPKAKLLKDLIELSNKAGVVGWRLASSDGYYAGELELSYSLTIFDVEPPKARSLALAIKARYHQQEVILEKLPNTDVRFL
jgi:hypothetical protein